MPVSVIFAYFWLAISLSCCFPPVTIISNNRRADMRAEQTGKKNACVPCLFSHSALLNSLGFSSFGGLLPEFLFRKYQHLLFCIVLCFFAHSIKEWLQWETVSAGATINWCPSRLPWWGACILYQCGICNLKYFCIICDKAVWIC